MAALNHPNIVGVHDFGQAGGFYFLLMEFVDGMNLRRPPVPQEEICDAERSSYIRAPSFGFVRKNGTISSPAGIIIEQRMNE